MSDTQPTTQPAERLRSWKARRGRMGPARQEALETLLSRFAVPGGEAPLDLAALFGAGTPVVLEIGFGTGGSTLAMAEADRATGVLAAEVHEPGVAALLLGLDERDLENVRVLSGDGRDLLERRIPSASLAGIRVYFPDPWPKSRHHKRRLVDAGFAALVADRLAPGGRLHCATDWEPYGEQMIQVVDAEPGLVREDSLARPDWRPPTRYETRGLGLGHRVVDVLATRAEKVTGAVEPSPPRA